VTQRRLAAGDVTPTDTAQAQVIGTPPVKLEAAQPIDRFLPRSREQAIEISAREHPAVLGAQFDTDVAEWTIHVAESSLLPQLNVQGNRNVQTDTTLGTTRTDQASVLGTLNVPIYDGGLAASQTRQAKETLTQSRLVLEQVRNQARTAVVSAWVASEGAKVAVAASEAEVSAATVALQGVQREAQGGQRTTVDVLNAQGDLMAARARPIGAQRDRIIASYTLLAAVGHLDVKTLGLNTPDYLPETHYHQVHDSWGVADAVGAIGFLATRGSAPRHGVPGVLLLLRAS
jgi:outer membrane protein